VLRDAVASAMPAVRSGGQVGPALENTRAFPKQFVRAFAVGEHTGELDREILRVGEKHREAAMRRLEMIAEWVPRILYVAILAFVAWRIIGSYVLRLRDIQRATEY
jgi:type II secretory pathway component PulF